MINWRERDIERLKYCRLTSPEMTNAEIARYYNFNIELVNNVFGEDAKPAAMRKGKRPDWRQLAVAFADQNPEFIIDAEQLATVIGCSLPTAYKTINDLPNSFHKVKRGVWEMRNEKQDRANGH